MTDSEFPDPLRGLLGETGAASPAPLEPASVVPVESQAAPGFTSRRAAREAGAYRSTEPAPAGRPRPVKRPGSRTRSRDAVRARLRRSGGTDWRRKASSAGVMSVVVGLLATLAIPALADQRADQEQAGPVDAQTYQFTAAAADASLFVRDSYGTTSAADLRRLYADAIRQQNLAAYLASGARELGDDYPWPDALSRPQGGGLSPLNYYYRECVDFVAWRLNRDVGSTSAPFRWVWSNLAQGSAYTWKRAWENHGWPVSSTPVPGAVAWFPGGNHVAYVSGVLPDGSVALEEYNYSVDHGYSQRIIPASGAIYLYPPG